MQTRASVFNKKDIALLGAAAAVLFVATAIVSGKRPFWYDEVFSWTLITDPSFRHMMKALALGAESPPGLYHVLARPWLAITGHSLLALRMLATLSAVVAMAATWMTLRRAFSLRATAVGVLTVFCTSAMMLYHSAEARYYPMFVACTALAIAVYARAIESPKLTWRLAAALFVANITLVQVHIYGVAYSAAILFALLCCDLAARRFRPLTYACVAVTWASLVPWLPTFHLINEQTKPRHWIMPPTLPGVVEFYRLYSLELPMILFAVAVLCFVGRLLFADQSGSSKGRAWSLGFLLLLVIVAVIVPGYPSMFDIALLGLLITFAGYGLPRPATDPVQLRRALMVAAAMLLCAPPAAAIFSLLVKPVFVPKYVLPSMLGMAILLTWIVESGSRFPLAGRRASMMEAGWAGLIIAMLLMPLFSATRESSNQPPQYGIRISDVEELIPPGLPVAVESYCQFLPFRQNTKRPGHPYYYVGDHEAAGVEQADRSAMLGFNGSRVWKGLGYLSDSDAPEWPDFLATHPKFAVLHSPGHFWFDWRIRNNPEYTWRSAGSVGSHEVFYVERKASTTK